MAFEVMTAASATRGDDMSTEIHERVLRRLWKAKTVEFDLKAVLTAITVHSDDHLTFVGTQKRLQELTGLSYERASQAVTFLEDGCAISIRKRDHRQTAFEVTPHGFIYLMGKQADYAASSHERWTDLDWTVLQAVWQEMDFTTAARALVSVATIYKQPSGVVTTSGDELCSMLSMEEGPLVTQLKILRHYGLLSVEGERPSLWLQVYPDRVIQVTGERRR